MDCLYIVVPAYNEEENIADVIRQWHPVVEKVGGDSRLLILNDGSKDSTYEKMLALRENYPRLLPVDKENQGHGATVLRGYRYAITHGADYVFQTDSDGQTLPEEFWPLWRDRKNGGLLIGYRKGRQDGMSRVVVTKVLRLVLFACFGVWVLDANTPFRLMEASQLEEVMEKIPKNFNLSNVVMTVVYEKFGLGVHYYPITFRPRQGGTNSINLKRIFGIGRQALKDFWKLRRRYAAELRRKRG
ncbi:MAG: glycosyltransferase family 2 protein [Blautia sp.]|jgi:dolichol-phosphate mannosyltransferase